ncbi:MAG: type II secretion system F family protein [Desulfobacteraceae bacterium]|nr:type II secretion system F family protein [Desulfobacteraceae bacterium]
MPTYTFQAINESGATVNEQVEAESLEMANNIIIGRGYIPTRVTESGAGMPGGFDLSNLLTRFARVRPADLILFTKQLRTLLRAGVSMLKLLEVLEGQTESPALRRIIGEISSDIQQGSSLYEAFSRHPKAFSPLYCGMVKAGEASGALPEVLDRLTYIIEHEQKIRSDVKAALQYPIIVMVLLGGAFFILLAFVIPKFVNIFTRTGVDIPVPTQICMWMYQFLIQYWYFPLTGAVVLIVGLGYYFRTEAGRLWRDRLLLRIPVVGTLLSKTAMSRFASIFSILQASGISARESIKILSGTIGNAAIAQEFDGINEKLSEGRGISEPLRQTRYFTPIVINMIAIGEESGNLEEMLKEISEHYDVEVEYAMKKLSDAIGPALTIGLAAVVGFFALAIFLPMWDLTKMVK